MTDLDDELLLMHQLREGNESALARFFNEHHQALTYFATRITMDEAQAKEVVSDCFLKLWHKRADFESPQKVKSFLFVSCRNACFDYLSTLKVRTAAQERYMHHLETAEESIFYEAVQMEVLDLVNKEIAALPARMQEVFSLLYLEGKSTAEVAAKLNLSIQTVRNQKNRSIELIRTALIKKGLSASLIYFVVMLLTSQK